MFAVDVGGTFTDVVAVRNGEVTIAKVSSNPVDTHTPVLQGAAELGVADAVVFNHASTHGLNAIITRRLPKVAFLTTEGQRDILDIGSVMRPWDHVTDPSWRRSFGDVTKPVVPRYLRRGVRERVTAAGRVAIALDEASVRAQVAVLARCNVQGVAVCLLNSYVNGDHERRVRELVHEGLGDVPVSLSSEVSPIAMEYARASTTVVDVIMKLMYGSYTDKLHDGLTELGFAGELNYGDSAGTLMSAAFAMEQPYRVVFSGPAGGTSASAYLGAQIDCGNVLCADVGGTSCDISVVTNGRPYRNLSFEFEPDLPVNSLSTDIATLGAGGGSVVSVNAVGEIVVGPDSAGSRPGPACYGQGGTRPTVTDLALLIGIIDPAGFGGGRISLSPQLAEEAVRALDVDLDFSAKIRASWTMGLNNIVEGIFNVALRHGVDPRGYSLMAFGAAGPMMLPSVLEPTHVDRVIVPPFPGHFSALGLLSGDLVYADSRTLYAPLDETSADAIEDVLATLAARLRERIPPSLKEITVSRSFDARLVGQRSATPFVEIPEGPVTAATIPQLIERFHDVYELRNGNSFRHKAVEAVTFRVQMNAHAEKLHFPQLSRRSGGEPEPISMAPIRHLYGDRVDAPAFARDRLLAGDVLTGPAVVREAVSTTFVAPGQTLTVGSLGEMVITRAPGGQDRLDTV